MWMVNLQDWEFERVSGGVTTCYKGSWKQVDLASVINLTISES